MPGQSEMPAPRPIVVKNQGFLPFAGAPIHYRTTETLTDQITELQRRIDRGEVKLQYEEKNGYLRSVLELLRVPVDSQTLVFSKTSLQFQHIQPQAPRALYFNDNVYVGQVQNAKSIELIAFDANQGAIFYVLGEQKVDSPRFERAQLDCVQCHIATATKGIPGVMVRSMLTTPTGMPKGGAPIYTMGHETPMAQRWGGWYVTGSHAAQTHQGNNLLPELGKNIPSVEAVFDTKRYLTPHSDIVAHLVLAHQTQMHNLVTEVNYRYRLGVHANSPDVKAQYERNAEATLRYLLFSRETPLEGPIVGSSSFRREFEAIGPKDRQGRSLRDFDLEKRIFRYPCSYLIYTDAFDAIPGPAKEYLLKRLFEVLTGQDQSADFAHLSAKDRRAILEILVDTKPGLPAEWKQFLNQPVSQINRTNPETKH